MGKQKEIKQYIQELEEEAARDTLYDIYGSSGLTLIYPIIQLAKAARKDYPDEVLELLREF
jgi:hypothetical protein